MAATTIAPNATRPALTHAALAPTPAQCEPHYIRCIKPNDEKRSGLFNVERVTHQVRYLGLLENVRVRRAGYAYRQTFERFSARYKMLADETWPFGSGDAQRDTDTILRAMGVVAEQYQFGKQRSAPRTRAQPCVAHTASGRAACGDVGGAL